MYVGDAPTAVNRIRKDPLVNVLIVAEPTTELAPGAVKTTLLFPVFTIVIGIVVPTFALGILFINESDDGSANDWN